MSSQEKKAEDKQGERKCFTISGYLLLFVYNKEMSERFDNVVLTEAFLSITFSFPTIDIILLWYLQMYDRG